MALKDWKKKRSGENQSWFINKKTGKDLIVIRYVNTPKVWHVTSEWRWNVPLTKKNDRTFKTKSKALAYAKAYMRKH